ncbi:MAG: pentapeptide repeat-containing protein [Sphingomonas sp.]|uniref:pentapeptide repeat-containing protein n=1 Tax=Sphingomonas sp. TaxID=28214 RepID=UPI003562C50A
MEPADEQFIRAVRDYKGVAKSLGAVLTALCDLTPDGEVPAAGFAALRDEIGRRERGTVQAATLRQRLKRLNDALAERDAPFRVETKDERVRAVPGESWARAVAVDEAGESLAEAQGQAVRLNPAKLVEPRAMIQDFGKPPLVMFSYAWLDAGPQQGIQIDFFNRLRQELQRPPERIGKTLKIDLWRDETNLDRTRESDPQFDATCRDAFLIVLMLSSKFIHSTPCKREVDFFLSADGETLPGKRCLGIRVNTGLADLDARYKAGNRIILPNGQSLLALWEKGDEDDKHRFVVEVADAIRSAALDHLKQRTGVSPSDGRPDTSRKGASRATPSRSIAAATDGASEGDTDDDGEVEALLRGALLKRDCLVDPRARKGTLGRNPGAGEEPADRDGVAIADHLVGWAQSTAAHRPRMAALLGDFGMGKTVTCQLVWHRMSELRASDETVPPTFYFDLRLIRRPDDPDRTGLAELVAEMVRRPGAPVPNAERVIDYIRRKGALVIFDGLDEVTSKLSPASAKRIYGELLSIVPAPAWRNDEERRRDDTVTPQPAPSILISCRSQYFADAVTERSFLTDSDRSGLNDPVAHIATYVMLPFNGEQVRDYLQRNLGEEAERALAVIEGTYDLGELASRPILLRYIGEMYGRLEQEKLAGRPINIARLYDILVEQAFERDNPKHVIPISDKMKLLRALAVYLHRRGTDGIANKLLTDWLRNEIATNHPLLSAALSGQDALTLAEIFVQDLRNAALLSRPDESEFRFGHTSLREYFLADALYQAVIDRHGDAVWAMPMPSHETFDFVLRRLEIDAAPEQAALRRGFPALIEQGKAREVRAIAFAFWRHALAAKAPLPRPAKMDCSGLDLMGSVFASAPDAPLPLQASDWTGANLRESEFRDADLSDASFAQADMRGAMLVRSRFDRVDFEGARLAGSRWRGCTVTAGAIDASLGSRVEARDCLIDDKTWPAQKSATGGVAWSSRLRGHQGYVHSVALGMVAGRAVIVSGGSDRSVRLWDAESGDALRTLNGHQGDVRSVALGMIDGRAVVVSGGYDRSVRLWDAESGDALRTLNGHGDWVQAVALGTVAGRAVIISGGFDRSVRVWDAESGNALRALSGNERAVQSLSLAMIARRAVIASGGTDGSVHLWDVESGNLLRTLNGHQGDVNSVALGMVAGRTVIVSGGSYHSLRLWDAESGDRLGTLDGCQGNVRSVALGMIERRAVIVSGGDDGIVRLWDAESGDALRRLYGHGDLIQALALGIFADGRAVIVSGGGDRSVRLWDAESGDALRTLNGHQGDVNSVALGMVAGRAVIVSGGDDRSVGLWDAESGNALRTFNGNDRAVSSVALGMVSERAVIVSGGHDHSVRLWDAEHGDALRALNGHQDSVLSVALGLVAGCAMIVSGGADCSVRLWDAESGDALRTLNGHLGYVHSVALGMVAGRAVIVSGSNDRSVRLWDAETGDERRTFRGDEGSVRSVAMGMVAGRAVVVAGSSDRRVRLWDAESGESLRTLDGHQGEVLSVAMIMVAGRAVVVSGGTDRSMRLWDAESGDALRTLYGHQGQVLSVALGMVAGRAVIVSGGRDNSVRLWGVSPDALELEWQKVRVPGLSAGLDFTADAQGNLCLTACEADAWRVWEAECTIDGRRTVTAIEDMVGKVVAGGVSVGRWR